jgi:hypothetical protein
MPLHYTNAPDVVADMKTLFRSGLPQDVASISRDDEDVEAFAEIMAMAEGEVAGFVMESVIATAHGVWLTQHGRDRGTRPLLGETDDQFRLRLQHPPTAGTTSAILAALIALMSTDKIYLVELPRQSMYLNRSKGLDRGHRMGGRQGVVIALIPASADAASSSLVILRTVASAGKAVKVEEYV